jgi:hypothetical protein
VQERTICRGSAFSITAPQCWILNRDSYAEMTSLLSSELPPRKFLVLLGKKYKKLSHDGDVLSPYIYSPKQPMGFQKIWYEVYTCSLKDLILVHIGQLKS